MYVYVCIYKKNMCTCIEVSKHICIHVYVHFCIYIYIYIVEISPSVYVWLKFVSGLDQDSPGQRARGKRAC